MDFFLKQELHVYESDILEYKMWRNLDTQKETTIQKTIMAFLNRQSAVFSSSGLQECQIKFGITDTSKCNLLE